MSTDLDQKALELALAVQKLDQLTKALLEYSEDIQVLSRKISEGDKSNE